MRGYRAVQSPCCRQRPPRCNHRQQRGWVRELACLVRRLAEGGYCLVRELAVVLDLVLESTELLNDLLALSLSLRVLGLGDGTEDIVNGAGLRLYVSGYCVRSSGSKPTKMTGHR